MKILGVHWNPLEDAFRFTMDVEEFKLPAQTPRQLVGVQCSLFNPQGFIAPFIFLGRKSLQLSVNDRKRWDSCLTEELKEKFFQWATSIPILRSYAIPRWWNTEATQGSNDVSLHIFCNAASTGFGAVTYFWVVAENGEVFCTIITSRAHVVPLDSSKASHHNSIPLLELTAAEKGTQL